MVVVFYRISQPRGINQFHIFSQFGYTSELPSWQLFSIKKQFERRHTCLQFSKNRIIFHLKNKISRIFIMVRKEDTQAKAEKFCSDNNLEITKEYSRLNAFLVKARGKQVDIELHYNIFQVLTRIEFWEKEPFRRLKFLKVFNDELENYLQAVSEDKQENYFNLTRYSVVLAEIHKMTLQTLKVSKNRNAKELKKSKGHWQKLSQYSGETKVHHLTQKFEQLDDIIKLYKQPQHSYIQKRLLLYYYILATVREKIVEYNLLSLRKDFKERFLCICLLTIFTDRILESKNPNGKFGEITPFQSQKNYFQKSKELRRRWKIDEAEMRNENKFSEAEIQKMSKINKAEIRKYCLSCLMKSSLIRKFSIDLPKEPMNKKEIITNYYLYGLTPEERPASFNSFRVQYYQWFRPAEGNYDFSLNYIIDYFSYSISAVLNSPSIDKVKYLKNTERPESDGTDEIKQHDPAVSDEEPGNNE